MVHRTFLDYELDQSLFSMLEENLKRIEANLSLYSFKIFRIEKSFKLDLDSVKEDLLLYKLEINKENQKNIIWGELNFYFSNKSEQKVFVVLEKFDVLFADCSMLNTNSDLDASDYTEDIGISLEDYTIFPSHTMTEKHDIVVNLFDEVFKMLD